MDDLVDALMGSGLFCPVCGNAMHDGECGECGYRAGDNQ